MKLLYHVHGYKPVHNAGAESMIHNLGKWMVSQGHEVRVLCPSNMGPAHHFLDGVEIYCQLGDEQLTEDLYSWADYVLTHLDLSAEVGKRCARLGKKFLYLMHNARSWMHWEMHKYPVHLAIFNSYWLKHTIGPELDVKKFVLYPPVFVEDYKVERTPRYNTLVNLSANKGAVQFQTLARELPEQEFLGVVGAYDPQHADTVSPNLLIHPHSKDVKNDIYAKTKVTLMPSQFETWGMVAVESMCSGIPVVANPTQGLIEACGFAGIFIDRDQTHLWKATLERLWQDEAFYEHQSNLAVARSLELEVKCLSQLQKLERKLLDDLQSN